MRVCCSRSATTVATLPPKQLKNRAAPTRVEGAALSKALAVDSLARSAKINPLSNRTEIGKILQKTRLRRRRPNSIKIRCATAKVSRQYFIVRSPVVDDCDAVGAIAPAISKIAEFRRI